MNLINTQTIAENSKSSPSLLPFKSDEAKSVLYSFAYFFFLLSSYYILRPLRDEMGIQGGLRNLQWLFLGTFAAILAVVPLYGYIVSRFSPRKFLPWVYLFFVSHILLFWGFLRQPSDSVWIARAFFIWTSVFNLFIVSVFWSFMSDLFTKKQANRLYGFIAAGGTLGAIAGPLITIALIQPLGTVNLLLVSALLLVLAIGCILKLTGYLKPPSPEDSQVHNRGTGGNSLFAGASLIWRSWYLMGICLFIFLYSTCSTFLYFAQAQIVSDAFESSADRTAIFATMDFLVNALTLVFQLFVIGKLLDRLGTGKTLLILPIGMAVGFCLLGVSPILLLLIIFQVMRRSMNYAINRPVRETLFTTLTREEKYKAKNFIDTVVYRGGDAATAWVFAGLKALGLSLSVMLWIAVPITFVWGAVGLALGRNCDKKARLI